MILGTLYAPKKKHDSRKKIRTIEGLRSYGFQGDICCTHISFEPSNLDIFEPPYGSIDLILINSDA
jgi:hypothetical protein